MTEAIVVGAGPNGLTAAVLLAQAGVKVTVLEAASEIGGGTRTSELTLPGLLHDHCSAVHPMGAGSPVLQSLKLERHGLVWRQPEVDLAHPLDGGAGASMWRSLAQTQADLGVDGRAWQRLFEPLSSRFEALADEVFRPVIHLPKHPLRLAHFGVRALQPASWVARRWRTEGARALFAGVAAHAFQSLRTPTTAAIGMMLIAAGHRYGWPVAQGGSRAITDALAATLRDAGGVVQTGRPVRSVADLPAADIVMFDLSPRAVVDIMGERLPGRVRRALGRWRHGPAAFKLDLAVSGGIPWTYPPARRAGTVHLGGTFEQIDAAERAIGRGELPRQPFVLIGQQYLADPTRSRGDVHPVWAYAHVPNGYPGDASAAILDQIERFAPGTKQRIVATAVRTTTELATYNLNYVGGDIATGANTPRQVMLRPRFALDPYQLGVPGYYLCSAATPPGAGVHGMCGYHAARSALRYLGS
ncbi:dehydrogenase [Rhizocola hellebori]|uniref:Dehydrogenase n=1 Tax=Rhizocola hellebori TaxID=1392758 RepID=A0A8J3QGZ2_9ACTN|nr:NAD(P)/FAD-dependent oxidoreductase [Rhizocola hellebori]GIH09454.1 dehydrogenase [Rhizocola hellebori]